MVMVSTVKRGSQLPIEKENRAKETPLYPTKKSNASRTLSNRYTQQITAKFTELTQAEQPKPAEAETKRQY